MIFITRPLDCFATFHSDLHYWRGHIPIPASLADCSSSSVFTDSFTVTTHSFMKECVSWFHSIVEGTTQLSVVTYFIECSS
jgi:hypothetical protein